MKKITILSVVLIAAVIFGCGGSSEESRTNVVFDFNNNTLLPGDVPGIKADTSASAIPIEVDTVDIEVYQDAVALSNLLQKKTFTRASIAANKVQWEVSAGDGRYFVLTGRDILGSRLYSGQYGPVNLIAQKDTVLTIPMMKINTVQNARLVINLLDEEGTAAYAAPAYLRASNTLITEVFRPARVNDKVEMGDPLSQPIAPGKSFSSTLSGYTAYPDTCQMVLVKAMTIDGTVAAVGGMSLSTIKEGENIISVRMLRPGRLVIRSAVPVTSVRIDMNIGGSFYTVANSGYTADDGIGVIIPNAMANYGKNLTPVKPVTIRYWINGVQQTPDFVFDNSSDNKTLNWSVKKIP